MAPALFSVSGTTNNHVSHNVCINIFPWIVTHALINLEAGLLPVSPPDDPLVFPKIVIALVIVPPGSKAHSSFLRLQLGAEAAASCTPFVKKY